jgi:hypothetical protein
VKRFLQAGAVGAIALGLSGGASAALDTAVTDAITASQADLVTAGGLIIAMAAVAMGLRWVKATFF